MEFYVAGEPEDAEILVSDGEGSDDDDGWSVFMDDEVFEGPGVESSDAGAPEEQGVR